MVDIPGAKANPLTSQLLVSSGVPTLDKLLGGGLPVGSITLIQEDEQGTFAKTLLKYFIVEAIASNQHTLTISLDNDPNDILKSLPALASEQPKHQTTKNENSNKMKIAFRYQNLPTNEKEVQSVFGHYYDLSAFMPEAHICRQSHSTLSEEDLSCFNPKTLIFKSSAFNSVINKVNQVVKNVKFNNDEHLEQKNILRIGIHQLGTVLWDNEDELPKFLYYLRCILRQSFAIALITIPTHFSDKLKMVYESRLINSADIALRLLSFSGTKYEKNKALADFHGFFYVDKLAPINTLLSAHPGAVEYTFKLLRKKFSIEKLNLPPDIELDSKDDKRKIGSVGCGSTGSKSLDF